MAMVLGGFWLGDYGGQDAGLNESPPSDLAGVLALDVITLTWTDTVTDNTGYAVEKKVGAGPWEELEADAGDVETYDDETGSFSEDVIYRYRLRVVGGALDGEFSNIARVGDGVASGVGTHGRARCRMRI